MSNIVCAIVACLDDDVFKKRANVLLRQTYSNSKMHNRRLFPCQMLDLLVVIHVLMSVITDHAAHEVLCIVSHR